MRKKNKLKILEEENSLFKFFVAQILTVCSVHVNEIINSNDDTNYIQLSDFTLTFNVQSFVNYFMENYGDNVSYKPNKVEIKKLKTKWVNEFKNIIYPEFIKELGVRREMYGIEKKDEVKEEDEETERLYS